MSAFGHWKEHQVVAHNAKISGAGGPKREPQLDRASVPGCQPRPARPNLEREAKLTPEQEADIDRTMRAMGFKPVEKEAELHDYGREWFHSHGWLCVESAMHKPTTTQKGVPDHIGIGPKHVVFVEYKRPGQKLRPEQQAWVHALKALGWPTAVVHTRDEFDEFMKGKL